MKNKKLIILSISIFITFGVNAQDTGVKNRWNIKTTYFTTGTKEDSKKMHNLIAEGNYGIFKVMEVGGYIGYGFGNWKDLLYGGNLNIHILPIFIESSNLRLDIYASGKIGIGNMEKEMYNKPSIKQNELTWGYYLGASYYLFKHFGFYIETGYEQFTSFEFTSYSDKQLVKTGFNMRLGLTYKF